MYSKNDKKRIYWIIDEYLSGKIDETKFCDEFYYSYNLEIDKNTLNELEQTAFKELSEIAFRFSPYDEDYNLDQKAFVTRTELTLKITEIKNYLG